MFCCKMNDKETFVRMYTEVHAGRVTSKEGCGV